MAQSKEILTPTGRLVQGHPMERNVVIDSKTRLPVMEDDGVTKKTSIYLAIAIAKGAETHWNQTPWGAEIWAAGNEGWPTGEWGAADFAWKVTDGDSAIPGKPYNGKPGRAPNTFEGYPGHWVLKCTTYFSVPCYHPGKYEPHQVMQQPNAIKRGDYIRMALSVKGNSPSLSPGVYVNAQMCELIRAGIEIISENAPDPGATFGATAAAMPANALVDHTVAADPNAAALAAAQAGTVAADPNAAAVAAAALAAATPASAGAAASAAPPPPSAQAASSAGVAAGEQIDPAYDFLVINGTQQSVAALRAAKWTEPEIAAAR